MNKANDFKDGKWHYAVEQLKDYPWTFAHLDQNVDVVRDLKSRLEGVAVDGGTITYKKLLDGVSVYKPVQVLDALSLDASGLDTPKTTYEWHKIDARYWSQGSKDSEYRDELLDYISAESYKEHGFMLSAIVVNQAFDEPSWGFLSLAFFCELLKGHDERGIGRDEREHRERAEDAFVRDQQELVYDHYRSQQQTVIAPPTPSWDDDEIF